MNEKQSVALSVYLSLGPTRSLAKTVNALRERGIAVSLPTLKRFSSRCGWRAVVAELAAKIASEASRRIAEVEVDQTVEDLHSVSVLKCRFRDRARLDPADQTLTVADRKRAVDINVRDFIKLVEIEHEIFDRLRLVAAEPVKQEQEAGQLGTDLLKACMAEYAKHR